MDQRAWTAIGLAIITYTSLPLMLVGRRWHVPAVALAVVPFVLNWIVFVTLGLIIDDSGYAWVAFKLSFLIPVLCGFIFYALRPRTAPDSTAAVEPESDARVP
jgi:hypothetical protein